jgi:adenylate cyclase
VLKGARRYSEALEVLKNAIELDPKSSRAHDQVGLIYVNEGMIEEGISEIKIAVENSGGLVADMKSDLAYAYAKAGNVNAVKNILADMLLMREQTNMSETQIAGVYVSLGEKDKAMEWLEKAYERHAGYIVGINFDSSFDDFRSDPRFQAFLRKVGFPDVG